MGDCYVLSEKKFEIWVGGNPKPDWSGLDPSATNEYPSGQNRPPVSPTRYALKAKSARLEAPEPNPKFKKGDNVGQFSRDLFKIFQQRGLDTIRYLADPLDDSKMLSVVTG